MPFVIAVSLTPNLPSRPPTTVDPPISSDRLFLLRLGEDALARRPTERLASVEYRLLERQLSELLRLVGDAGSSPSLSGSLISGCIGAAPYDPVPNPGEERIKRGAFDMILDPRLELGWIRVWSESWLVLDGERGVLIGASVELDKEVALFVP